MGVQVELQDIQTGFLSAAAHTANNTLIEEGLNKALDRTASTDNAMAVNLDMGNNRAINAADAVLNSDFVTLKQLNGAIAAAGSGLITMQTETQKGSEASGQVFTLGGITYTVAGNNLLVFQNGVKLYNGRDYTETSSSSITVDSSVTINDNDDWDFVSNLATTNSTTDTSAITHTQSGTDYNLATYLQNSYVVNVKDFGAVGDGVTDDTAAAQAAIDFAYDSGDVVHKEVFFPTPPVGYVIHGLTGYGRVNVRGESRWGCRIILATAGDYFIHNCRHVSEFFFDGVSAIAGSPRIDEASWTSADRTNTGIIVGDKDEGFEFQHGKYFNNRFINLGVAIERRNSVDTSINNNFINTGWHGIYNRATNFAADMNDTDNYIQNMEGIGIGFYGNTLGYNNYTFDGSVVETCCKNVLHHGIHGNIDAPASIKSFSGNHIYMEVDDGLVDFGTTDGTTSNKLVDSTQTNFIASVSVGDTVRNLTDKTEALVTAVDSNTTLSLDTDIMTSGEEYIILDTSKYINSIGIRSNLIGLKNFFFQGYKDPIKAIGTSTFWRLEDGEIIEGTSAYDITIPVVGGRNEFRNIAFTRGVNPASLGFTTLVDCSNSGILPDGKSNSHISDGNMYVGRQGAIPLTLNRRTNNGGNIDLQRQGVSVNELQTTTARSQWSKPHGIPTYTVSTLPSASTYKDCLITVSDETGGYTVAFSDGTIWRRVIDNVQVS